MTRYRCVCQSCNHVWFDTTQPKFCPSCGTAMAESALEGFSRLFDSPEIPPDPKRQGGEPAGSTPKITNNMVWPPTEPPLAEGIRKREEVVKWV